MTLLLLMLLLVMLLLILLFKPYDPTTYFFNKVWSSFKQLMHDVIVVVFVDIVVIGAVVVVGVVNFAEANKEDFDTTAWIYILTKNPLDVDRPFYLYIGCFRSTIRNSTRPETTCRRLKINTLGVMLNIPSARWNKFTDICMWFKEVFKK